MSPERPILCINAGSSSFKLALFANDASERCIAKLSAPNRDEALARLDELLGEAGASAPGAVGHRVVHGGPRHVAPSRIDAEVVASLEALVPLAPLHLPPALDGIRFVSTRFPTVVQVACFDTAFHASLPEVAQRFPIAEAALGEDVRRYGFHGLSYEYVMASLGSDAPSRIVIAHLGGGSSLVAVRDGKAIDTTMGLTPTGGVVMGTRTGDIDPGVLVYLARRDRLSIDALDALVNRQSGLAGVGGTSDMQELLERAHDDPRARIAIDLFAYSVKKAIGSYVAALGGLDLLVFTGGIGENAAPIRSAVCAGLDALGITLDEAANARAHGADAVISASSSHATVRVIATDEDRMIARHVRRLLDA